MVAQMLIRSQEATTHALIFSSKLTSSIAIEQRGEILLEHRETPIYDTPQVLYIDQEVTWMKLIIRTLQGKIETRRSSYTLSEGVLYKKGFSYPLLQCLSPPKAKYSRKTHTTWFACATLAKEMLKSSDNQRSLFKSCQFIVLAVDYFTKWIEVEALATITEKQMESFLWKLIVYRFGIPSMIITDNGTYFQGKFKILH
ncbi:rve domain-containing protein/RVT_3 domain-containing protein [Gossypium australe]|uniref:Rve domain-containing protein/RVT_3 domain-containing protein n=1 Tax=Gossypium australe TaxID=47621 RepID=A0A5B6X0Q7_9ROSI|nr:rve domain-containing protein/RVT_3 domain-containing protein [Gossypium australe]